MRSIERFAEFAADWRFLWQADGEIKAAPVIAREFAGLAFRRAEFFLLTRSLREPIPFFMPKIALTIRAFQEQDVDHVRCASRPSEASLCEKRLACGQFGLVALHHDQFAGYTWAYPRVEPALERIILALGEHDIFATDDYTVPALRGQGVQTTLLHERNRQCQAQGYKRVVVYVEKGNAASLHAYNKTGYAVVARFGYFRIGNWRRVRWLAGSTEWQGALC